ncbi:uncharacterized protein LOC128984549 [Macrosteles quadrilineatus]|uniref:uncharacterized protein LOC128984549 n=1 Tax=Macrosteles quadrilineatus TaxID=74068 RepID=UPI0023E258B7|nr:uncharacterized protein LOC128984549 [Macrosteles quadrilineatus]
MLRGLHHSTDYKVIKHELESLSANSFFVTGLAINTAVHQSAGYTPAYLNFGKELRLPEALHEGIEVDPGDNPRVPDRLQLLRTIQDTVKLNLSKAYQRQAKYYNLRSRPNTFKEGQHVLCRRHELSDAARGFAAKLAPQFDGP